MITAVQIDALALRRGERLLFERFDLTLRTGDAVALTGRNGAGKTSLLRAVAGLIRPEAGSVRFEGATGALEAETARAEGLHLMGHHDGLKSGRTAREELQFQGQWTGAKAEAVDQAIETMQLTRLLDIEVRRLSAGQRRRLALARLVASPRALWLLDEPLAPLDSEQRARFGDLMARHLADGGLILAAVHDPLPVQTREAQIA
ncbi:MAG: heme ABC exporter, ATP-binding protein CcmA [Caulobacterales bacterium 68-7]|nr:heme ABC exporter ATP-binding protein CcmA [Caulobacterales bacterium]OJU10384.1 MAG: heme ABC exporter, ATP-binding protein CcmA [Caulobacterales bacterium 68-7]